ncbi:putative porin [Hydrogenophaga sp.]|uniref:putative porin n=1 Tax=Hydrogenophaga sp. TaxID=1904254 RepID=UPI00262AD302|nr:putative porin [Hydrogenophaga sp.]MDM7948574.1 putative porin [Hydrogenophaga sp.]
MKLNQLPVLRAVAIAALMSTGLAQAQDREDLETLKQTTLNLIQALVQQGVLSAEKADQLVKQAESKAKATVAEVQRIEPSTVRVQLVPESVRKQIAEQVREEVVSQAKAERWGDVNAVPEWVDRFRLEGDVRLGYQRDMFADGNAPELFFQAAGQDVDNTTEDRDRGRLRARLGIAARVTTDLSANLRLVTGSTGDPVSTNQTLGNSNGKLGFALDRAFLRWRPTQDYAGLSASAGRIPNPFFSTDLVWDDDLSFDGLAVQLEDSVASTKVWRPFATAGVFPLQDIERSLSNRAKSKYMIGAQTGVEWVPSNDLRAKLGLAVYDFRNISGELNPVGLSANDETAPRVRQKGNTLFNISNPQVAGGPFALASDYKVLSLTGVVDYRLFDPAHVILSADFVRNIGFDAARIQSRSGLAVNREDKGYLVRVAVGMPSMLLKDDWQLSLAYRYLESDAVVDAFTDSDFHLGGTNSKGFIVGAQYGLSRNTWLSGRWLSSREISGLPLSINTLQVYFNARF